MGEEILRDCRSLLVKFDTMLNVAVDASGGLPLAKQQRRKRGMMRLKRMQAVTEGGAATIDEMKKWFKDNAEAAKGKTIVVMFKYNDSDMYEGAETETEAIAIAIRLSKTYGRAQFTNSTGAQKLFINGEAVVDNGQPT